jgi:hypothetical protein
VFFSPEIFSSSHTTPLPQVVDSVVQSCPIDTRRALYGNIVLSVSAGRQGSAGLHSAALTSGCPPAQRHCVAGRHAACAVLLQHLPLPLLPPTTTTSTQPTSTTASTTAQGGSTMFRDFNKRLERDVGALCKRRLGPAGAQVRAPLPRAATTRLPVLLLGRRCLLPAGYIAWSPSLPC